MDRQIRQIDRYYLKHLGEMLSIRTCMIYVFITIYIVVSDGEYCNSMITIDTTIFIITYYIYIMVNITLSIIVVSDEF